MVRRGTERSLSPGRVRDKRLCRGSPGCAPPTSSPYVSCPRRQRGSGLRSRAAPRPMRPSRAWAAASSRKHSRPTARSGTDRCRCCSAARRASRRSRSPPSVDHRRSPCSVSCGQRAATDACAGFGDAHGCCRVQPMATPPSSRIGDLIGAGAEKYARAHGLVSRALEQSRMSLQTFLWESLSFDELSSMTQRLYERRETYGPRGLFPWERVWYERDLPPAPARLLIGGCGSGREMVPLAEAGYEVCGFDPAGRLCNSARLALPGRASVWQLRYEDLVASGGGELASSAPYSAVILGWGSFSHILDAQMRDRVIEVLHRLCPLGPILLSFHLTHARSERQPGGLLERGARYLGGSVGRLRRMPRPVGDAPVFLPHCGFIHRFSELEVERLARIVERQVKWGEELRSYPHCSFRT